MRQLVLLFYHLLTYCIASVWLVNGLFCKVLGWVPRHEQIVARILGEAVAPLLTQAIGFAEIGMALWVVSGIQRRVSAVTQIVLIGTMNLLEFFLAPDLLLWDRFNLIFALGFMGLIYYHTFQLRKRIV
ncbi:DoxX-like family protein [Catalinimonas alkaloidigena]|uniref:DoxX-like family protein n=1 Tax=Catalinimonas alkaloidigena TaxID=1075417 RepID=A0A1G8Y7T1_9BACT|nr:DoxX-like family protein [Catalinimonas alkaloidigena]SDJ98717.1 DoxX-like family protein [Catalinimonas alkaloidigena]